jgi:hypothetical protein
MAEERRGRREAFARFFEEPTREGLRELLRDHEGEFDEFDFKEIWPTHPDLARAVLALGNSGGGAIVVGMKEGEGGSLVPVGLDSYTDKSKVHAGIEKFLPAPLLNGVHVYDFEFKETEYGPIKGKKFQVLVVEYTPQYMPFVAETDGGAGGSAIRKAAIYVRRGTNSVEANYEELQDIINTRLSTYSTKEEFALPKDLAELKALYKEIREDILYTPRKRNEPSVGGIVLKYKPNPAYPDENYDQFIARLIEAKKRKISAMFGLDSASGHAKRD